jgi:putative exosortase-associated protein (TIGR04073 family)
MEEGNRRPLGHASELGEAVVCRIVRLKEAHRYRGQRKIRELYRRKHGGEPPINFFCPATPADAHFSDCQGRRFPLSREPMKKVLLASALLLGSLFALKADIHDPPINDFGPTRKLGRAMGNLMFCWSELPGSVSKVNKREGNIAAVSYGLVQGIGGTVFRVGAGVYELVAFPFPTYKASYRPFYKNNTHWIHGGHAEFPEELGFVPHRRYVRSETAY